MEKIGSHETWCIDYLKWNIGAFGDTRNEAILNLILNTKRFMQMNLERNRHLLSGFKDMRKNGILWHMEGRLRGPSPIADIKVPPESITLLLTKNTRLDFGPLYLTPFQKTLKKLLTA